MLLCKLCIGVSRKFHLHFTLIFYLRYYKMVQNLYKNWLLVLKITRGVWTSSYKQWKVQKVELWWVNYFCPKYTCCSAKTLYTQDLSNVPFNYLCEKPQNYLCHFWNHKSYFTTQLLSILLAQKLHTFYKSSPSKCECSDFPLPALKFDKFLMSVFKKKSVFLESLGLLSTSWKIILL